VLNPWVKIITATKDNIITVNIDGGRYNTVGITGISSRDLTGWDNVRILNCNIKNVQNAMLSIAASRCLIMGNTVTGTRNSGLLFTLGDGQKATHNTIANNNFEDMGDTAVAFHTTFSNTEMAYNIIHGNTAKNTQRITGGFAFDFEEGVGELKHHNVFSNNTVEQTTASTFSQCGLVMGDCRDSLITGNVAKGNRNILSIGIDIFKSKRVTVSNNIVDNFKTGIHTRLTDFAKVIGNTITDCGDNPSDLYSFGAITVANSGSVSNIDIINNTIIFSDTFPINAPAISGYIGSAYRLDNLRIKDNKIWKCQGFAIGFNISGQADNVMIKGNEIIGADNTLSAFVKFFNTTRLRVINNTMLDPLRGVNIQQCDDVIIRANSIIDRRVVKKLERYITLGSDQGQLSTNVLIENNDLMGATLTPTLMPSADFGTAVIKNNRGFVTSNYGTTAAIPKATTITHGLNVTPKQVFLMPRGAVSGMYVSNITATTFTINFTEATSVVFDWSASY